MQFLIISPHRSCQVCLASIYAQMEIAVKNDEALIKMAAIVQKAQNRSTGNNDGMYLTDAEKEQLIAEVGRVGVSK